MAYPYMTRKGSPARLVSKGPRMPTGTRKKKRGPRGAKKAGARRARWVK